MKITALSITMLCVFLSISLNAQFAQQDLSNLPNFSNICLEESVSQEIRITKAINTSTLSVFDKLKFQESHFTRHYHSYFNVTGNLTLETYSLTHNEVFPKWYKPPSSIKTDETGIFTFFGEENPNLIEGWVGSTIAENQHGIYQVDELSQDRYHFQKHSELTHTYYSIRNQIAKNHGLLPMYSFLLPTAADLELWQSEDYNVMVEGGNIIVESDQVVTIWNDAKKMKIIQQVENGNIIYTQTEYYAYDELFQVYLKRKVIYIEPQEFDNGDCYESVTTSIFSNYNSNCGIQELLPRNNEDYTANDFGFKIFPNPTSQYLEIEFEKDAVISLINIYDVNGNLLRFRKLDLDQNRLQFNVEEFASGMYLVEFIQDGQTFLGKFVKQN